MTETNGKSSRQVCVVMRIITFHAGQRVSFPFGLYETHADGKAAGDQASAAIGDMVRTCLIAKQHRLPDGTVNAEPVMQLGAFLNDLGIQGISHGNVMNEVSGSIVVATPKLIMPVKH
jgi:hypothetical protein